MMKVLIVSESDIDGGAARAAYRLHRSLLIHNVHSRMLVQRKTSDDYTVLCGRSKLTKIINRLRPLVDRLPLQLYRNRTKTLFSPSQLPFSNLVNRINEYQPDIVHLHWIASGMIPIKDLAKIKAKVIWSCHDMWPFTGGCHYDEECNGYKLSCLDCKVLDQKNAWLSRKVFNTKFKTYRKLNNLFMVGSSKWITKCIQASALTKDKNTYTLPNCVDTQLFRPILKDTARKFFKVPTDKRVILFSAMNVLGDPRKGAKEVFESINQLDLKDAIIVIAGSSEPETKLELPFDVYYISPLKDEVSLALMYNIADVIVVPSLQENLANSIVESMACGVPVVAFDIGGNPDLIDHKVCGYLAVPYHTKDLSYGIKYILDNDCYEEMSQAAVEKVLSNYDQDLVAKKYISLYKNVLEGF